MKKQSRSDIPYHWYKLHTAKYITKLDRCNLIRIRKVDEWKTAFSTAPITLILNNPLL